MKKFGHRSFSFYAEKGQLHRVIAQKSMHVYNKALLNSNKMNYFISQTETD